MLDGAREALAESGVHYSALGVVRGAHHLLAAAIHPNAWRMHTADIPDDRAGFYEAMARQMVADAKAAGAHTLLISSEYFWGTFERDLHRRMAAPLGNHPIEVLAFTRAPTEWAASSYLQALKGGEQRDFATYFKEVLAPWGSGLFAFRVIQRHTLLLPARSVTTVDYGAAKADVFAAAMAALGVNVPSPPGRQRVNPSPGLSDMKALLAVNRSAGSAEEKAEGRAAVMRRLTPGERADALLTDDQRAEIVRLTMPSAALLAAHFPPPAKSAPPADAPS